MNKRPTLDYDILVVGGGVSGFTAAYTIAEKDPSLTVLLLEESDIVGGKNTSGRETVEFLSNSNQYLKYILKKVNLAPTHRKVKGMSLAELLPNKISYSDEEIPLYCSFPQCQKLEYFLSKIENLSGEVSFHSPMASLESKNLDKITMEQYICDNLGSEKQRNYMRCIIHTTCGIQAKDMSALFYIVYCRSTGGIANQLSLGQNGCTSYVLENAREDICNTMMNYHMFQVNLNERAIGLWRDYHGISVITDQNRYKCLHVVVAISPDKVLLLDIRPPLSSRRRHVLDEMTYHFLETKVITHTVPRKFSGDVICGFEDSNAVQRSLDLRCLNPNHLFVFLYCNDNANMCKQFKRYFGDESHVISDSEFEGYHNFEVFGVPVVGILKDFDEIRRPLNRLFWAGSHTSTTWYGHLEGSVFSGIRAGIELLYDYKPQLLSRHDIIFLTQRTPPTNVYQHGKLNTFIRHRKYYFRLLLVTTGVLGLFTYKRMKK